jgi:nucleotide-binding universal stress UspA family protein
MFSVVVAERRGAMKILIAIDSSPSSEVVLEEVAARPWPNASVIVINVLDLFAFPSGIGGVGPVTDAEARAAEVLVKDAAKRLTREGLEVATTVTEGYPPTSIIAYAQEWGADFIVVGSHGHSGISRFLLGSVAQSVVRGAHCSVEIVRQRNVEGRTGMRILLATDGSEHSAAAARSVASRPWPEGTEVKVVCSVKVIVPAADPWFAAGDARPLLEEHSRQAREYLEAGEKMMREAGLNVSSAVLTDGAKASIVDEARDWGADLVVLGSHGRHGLNRILMGSVSEAVAMHAPCSVDVIRGEVPIPQE